MSSIDRSEVDKFSAMAAEWWDPNGKFRPLHQMNPIRLDYITRQIAAQFGRDLRSNRPFDGLTLLDIGCGGGLLAEPMTRLGAAVTGIDASERNIPVAQTHAEDQDLAIDYRATTAEELASDGSTYDIVLAMEVIEHVANPPEFVATCGALLKPDGLMICSTLNRTAKSFALAIVGAEWVLRWLPRGTHDWDRFVKPDEMKQMMEGAGLTCVDRTGMVFDPLSWRWSLSATDLSVNYVGAAVKG